MVSKERRLQGRVSLAWEELPCPAAGYTTRGQAASLSSPARLGNT